MDLGDQMQEGFCSMCPNGNCGVRLFWHIMHLIVSVRYFFLGLVNMFESFLISSGLLKRYETLNISKIQYLAIVIDSEEALQTLKVLNLLRWLAAIGLTNVCLYDKEGVLKRSEQEITERLKSEKRFKAPSLNCAVSGVKEITTSDSLLDQKCMNLEFISFSDGKAAVARAANFLFEKHYSSDNKKKPNFTEFDMAGALRAIGYVRPDPDLMLVYGPARCHLGFPAWRIRYTEIMHMGSLKSMKFGFLIKAIHRFTTVHQNYGK
ncbi:dehydrodolichyl diphosphate syntase complex subunit NUS1 isoform X1 [Olea europaea subsp. europaea]|uniref:ditrans,polycis-polyprenyl diphosphate synthase [(2E,6E)-farnesyldiphosphate specific] n=3 Tax=Olea europaea subsp. europaea TaxID=158383 RepID=A0A8S0SAE3_OLEEU|nr:dehydrodolichyl diphosphate syntase complex subunit NUS1 isoform X1 [Olea europaea subsp. europaea]